MRLGGIANFSELFNFNSEKLISNLLDNIWKYVSNITIGLENFFIFFISDFKKDNILLGIILIFY